ncbi:MAG: peptidoglycan recognition family protein [bacterium]
MQKYIDSAAWKRTLQSPDWYVRLADELKHLQELGKRSEKETAQQIGGALYGFFEERLERGEIALGTNGRDEDAERKSIDTIIIHHTSGKPGMTVERLNAMHLLRLYVPEFLKRAQAGAIQPIVSGHLRNGRQMFYAYHWLVRKDGSVERLLADEEIGWQAGKWEVNCRSVAICFDDDLSETQPSAAALRAAEKVLRRYTGRVTKERVFGHCQINPQTTCPGSRFLSSWGTKLINQAFE